MANIKTITLSGSETAVAISGSNCALRNDSTAVAYISASPDIVAGADGVLSIPAGGAAVLLGHQGTVYLSGTGEVQLCGSDYCENPFKTVSASGGSGADEVARAAINSHAGNADIHVSAEEKISWNSKADILNDDKTVYVASTGSDTTGDGTQNKPWATIQYAADMCSSSSDGATYTISVSGSNYPEDVVIKNKQCPIVLECNGAVSINSLDCFNCDQITINDGFTIGTSSSEYALSVVNGCAIIGNITLKCGSSGSASCLLVQGTGVATTPSHLNTITFDGGMIGVRVINGGTAYLGVITGTVTTLLGAIRGVVGFNEISSDTSYTTQYYTARSGRIYNGVQASVPSY